MRHLARAIASTALAHRRWLRDEEPDPDSSKPRPRTGAGVRLAARSVPGRADRREWSAALAAGRRVMRVLLVVHGFPPLARGGTETYSHALATRLRDPYGDDVAVLTREHRLDAPEYRVRDERRDGLRMRWINNTFRETRSFEETYDNPAITALAADFIDEIRPDVAHIHHLTCLSTGIVFELKQRGIPIVLTLHDYWLLCHRGQLLDLHLQRCDGPLEHGCAACVGVAGQAGSALYAGARVVRERSRHAYRRRLRSRCGGAQRRSRRG